MNVALCFVCEQPATRVCQFPNCTFRAFYCDGPCNNDNLSQQVHNHGNEDFKSVTYQDLQKSVTAIRTNLDAVAHKAYIDDLKKRIQIVTGKFNEIVIGLNKGLKDLEDDLTNTLKIELNNENQVVYDKVTQNDINNPILGRQIHLLIKKDNKYKNEKKVFSAIQVLKKDFELFLKQAQNFSPKKSFVSYKTVIQKLKILKKQGTDFENNKQYEQAIVKYNQVCNLDPSESDYHYRSGVCLTQLKRFQEAKKSLLKAHYINPEIEGLFFTLGFVCEKNCEKKYQKKSELQQAIRYYTEALNRNKDHLQALENRGDCYVQLKKQTQASIDYLHARELNPGSNKYTEKITALLNLRSSSPQRYQVGGYGGYNPAINYAAQNQTEYRVVRNGMYRDRN